MNAGGTAGRLIGGYELVREIGSGSTGTVYEARKGESQVAVREMHRHVALDPVIRERYRREAEWSLRHPGIVAVYDLVDWDTAPAVVMEYCPGGNISSWRIQEPDELVQFLHDTFSILAEVHRRGVIHRNLKPQNIFRIPEGGNGKGGYKIGDFWSAHIQDLVGLTTSSMFMGSVEYLPPEAAEGRPPDPRWDLYSLGVIAYRAVTGRLPRYGSILSMDSGEVCAGDLVEVVPAIPGWVEELVLSLLAPEAERPSNAAECLDILAGRRTQVSRPLRECLFCGRSNPADAPLCFGCGEPAPDLSPYGGADAESLVLRRIREDAHILEEFVRILRAVSGNPGYDPRLLLGDLRLYSREEKRRGTRLPVRIMDDLSPDSSIVLQGLLQRDWRVRILRRPQARALQRYRRGPLVVPAAVWVEKPGAAACLHGPAADPETVSMLASGLRRAREIGDERLRSLLLGCLMSAYRLVRAYAGHPMEETVAGAVRGLQDTLHGLAGRIDTIQTYLSSVYLGEIYAELARLTQAGAPAEEIEQQRALYDRYRQQERIYAELTGLLLEFRRKTDSLATHRVADSRSEMQDRQEMEQEIRRELDQLSAGVMKAIE